MKIISLRSDIDKTELNKLFDVRGAIRKVVAISAFVDIKSIDQLIDFVKRNADSRTSPCLKIFIDKSSSRFYSDKKTKNALLEKQYKIQNMCSEDSGIYLVQFGKLFHSKLYLIEGNKSGKVIMGSMNLTQKGVYENEEVLFSDDYIVGKRSGANKISKWINEYITVLESKSEIVIESSKGNYPSCMRQLLLDGSIYYELKEQSPFRFKLCLPEELLSLKQNESIDPLLDSKLADSISIESLISEPHPWGLGKKIVEIVKSRSTWKKYCVETCYGYWNPNLLNDELEATLKEIVNKRKPHYDAIVDVITSSEVEIKKSFLNLWERLNKKLDGVSLKEDWRYKNKNLAEDAWDKWFKNLKAKLENINLYERLISGVDSVPSPDVWNDNLSAEEFEKSFFDSLIYHWSKEYSKETSNLIAQAVAFNLRLDNNLAIVEADKLKSLVDDWLSNNAGKADLMDMYE